MARTLYPVSQNQEALVSSVKWLERKSKSALFGIVARQSSLTLGKACTPLGEGLPSALVCGRLPVHYANPCFFYSPVWLRRRACSTLDNVHYIGIAVETFIRIVSASLTIFREAALYILFGFIMAGAIRVYVRPETVAHYFHHGKFRSVVYAAFMGIPVPL